MKKLIILFLVISAILVGCSTDSNSEDLGLSEFEDNFMSSYNMLIDTTSVQSGRAAAPVWDTATDFATGGSVSDYPEVGQVTTWDYTLTSIIHTSGNPVYLVDVTTTYPNDDRITSTVEKYNVVDMGNDGVSDNTDIYVDNSGSEDSKFRSMFRTYFADKTKRFETIMLDANDETYELFDINGSLDYDITIPLGTNGGWSSMVAYSHNVKENAYWEFWGDIHRASVSGRRYYSQDAAGTQTYIFKEYGVAMKAEWDDTVAPILPDENKFSLFKGVMRVEIKDDVKTIRGRYVIDGNVVILINDGIVTVE